MNQLEILKYYSNSKIQEKILSFTKNKEVVGSFRDGRFFSRPDTLEYPKDIEERVKNGAVAFHCSVENWKNPMQLSSELSKDQLNKLRIGFDIILDIDAKAKFEHAKLAAIEVYNLLKSIGVSPGIKFSVDYEEPIIIKDNNSIKIVKIGEFVDNIIKEKGVDHIIDLNNAEITNIDEPIKVMSLNHATGKIEFKQIRSVIRHPINEDIYEISLKSGRKVKVTGSHSIFTLNNGEIKESSVKSLKSGDYVLIAKRLPYNKNIIKKINLIEEFSKLPEKNKIKVLKNGNKITLSEFNDKIINNTKIGYKKFIPSILNVNKEFCKILGYYIAEGCISNTQKSIIFSFGTHEKALINDLKKCMKKVFCLEPYIHKISSTQVQLVYYNKILSELFEKILKCGANAKNKRIPSIIFNTTKKNKLDFISAYYKGDGHISVGKRWEAKTSSKQLASDLIYLLTQLNIHCIQSTEINSEHLIKNNIKIKRSVSYKISFSLSYLKNQRTITTHPPLAIPTNHSGLADLYKLSLPKRDCLIRSRCLQKKHIGREQLKHTINFIKKTSRINIAISILKELLKG
ncbi:MAG: hypothetical protein J7K26_01750, partial [Candidatus Aenigmarchaeota archaeon]|nr:hypothetical protein [Candidatus Aenigmarchaeota archaeon]